MENELTFASHFVDLSNNEFKQQYTTETGIVNDLFGWRPPSSVSYELNLAQALLCLEGLKVGTDVVITALELKSDAFLRDFEPSFENQDAQLHYLKQVWWCHKSDLYKKIKPAS